MKMFLFILSTFFLTQNLFAQYKSGDLPIPHMWVAKNESDSRIKWFKDYKLHALSTKIGKTETSSQFIPKSDFLSMITAFDTYNNAHKNDSIFYLHIYFAAFSNQPPRTDARYPLYSITQQDLLTIIVVPSTLTQELTDGNGHIKYYTSSPMKGFVDITDIGTSWKNLYQQQYHCLDTTIDDFDCDNYDNCSTNDGFSDTRMIIYPYSYIHELKEEIKYQEDIHTNGIPGRLNPDANFKVTGFNLSFSAYTDAGDITQKGKYPKRLMILLGLTKDVVGSNQEFNVEDVPFDFSKRRQKPYPTNQENIIELFKKFHPDFYGGGLDNGQLCPTVCH